MAVSLGELLGIEIREARTSKGWTQLAVSERAFGTYTGERRVREYEGGKIKRPQPKVYLPICDALGISRERIAELKTLAGDTKAINLAQIEELRADKGSLQQALLESHNLARHQIEALAEAFEFEKPNEADTDEILDFLANIADDYCSVRDKGQSIRANHVASDASIGDLVTAVDVALDAANFDDAVLSIQKAIDLQCQLSLDAVRKQVDLQVWRGEIELLRGQQEAAANHFVEAANLLEPFDQDEANLVLFEQTNKLVEHADRYGGIGYKLAIEHYYKLLPLWTREKRSVEWAVTISNLAIAERSERTRLGNPPEHDDFSNRLSELFEAFKIQKHELHPIEWAGQWISVGITITEYAKSQSGLGKLAMCEVAASTIRTGIKVLAEIGSTAHWAQAKLNLASTLKEMVSFDDHIDPDVLIEHIIKQYRDVVEVLNNSEHTLVRAWAKMEYANALGWRFSQSTKCNDRGSLDLALSELTEALAELDRDLQPYDWARCNGIFALIHTTLGDLAPDTSRTSYDSALEHIDAALTVMTVDSFPSHNEISLKNRLMIVNKIEALEG